VRLTALAMAMSRRKFFCGAETRCVCVCSVVYVCVCVCIDDIDVDVEEGSYI
jgi:hypothetical protein